MIDVGHDAPSRAAAPVRDATPPPGRARDAAYGTLTAAFGFGTFWAFIYVSARLGWLAFDLTAVMPLFLLAIAVNLGLSTTASVWGDRRWCFRAYEVFNAVGLTVLLHRLGGVPVGILTVSYAIAVLHAETLRRDASAFVNANLCASCFAVMAFLEATGRWPAAHVLPPLQPGQYVASAVAVGLSLNVLAFYASRYAHQLRTLAHRLQEEVAVRTAELTRANADLGRAYDELRTAEADLVETEKRAALGVLVAGVAHEINNPISFIVGNLEPLRASLGGLRSIAERDRIPEIGALVERVAATAAIIGRGAERTAAVVEDLRTFLSIGDRRCTTVDVHECLDLVLRLLRPRWEGRITIHREDGRLPRIERASGQLSRVLMNVLLNACDAIADRGNIWLTTRHEQGSVVIAVGDDGAGIATDDLPRIFDPFFTRKTIGSGTGLGLAISRSIIRDHGGTISVRSEPGRGTTFSIAIPVGQPIRSERRRPTGDGRPP